jgi:hypothetical protein
VNYFQKFTWIIFLISMFGCNVFKSIDHPSTDAQYRSAAEACLDQGDIQCAESNLAKLSSNEQDVKLSLTAYLGMMEVGVTPATLMKSLYDALVKNDKSTNVKTLRSQPSYPFETLNITPFATSAACTKAQQNSYGILITAVTKLINTPTQAQRVTLFENTVSNGYQISSSSLNAYVRFLSLITFTAHLLAEGQKDPHQFKQSDLVASPSDCVGNLDNPLGNCGQPDINLNPNSNLTRGEIINTSFRNLTSADFNTAPTMYMIAKSVDELSTSISDLDLEEFDVRLLSTTMKVLATQFGTQQFANFGCATPNGDCPAFRAALLNSSIGDCE